MAGTALLKGKFNLKVGVSPRAWGKSSEARPPLPVRTATPQWASLQADVEAHLKQTIPMKEPLEVFEPMHHFALFAAPTTTVPALCLAACELVGGHRRQAMAAASALLLSLANAHAHHQLHLTDTYGPDVQLLTGDAIVPFGFQLLAGSDANSDRVLRVIIEISRAVGSTGLVEAQYMKKTLPSFESDDVEPIRRVVEKNEGGMHACGAACGAILGGGTEDQIGRLRKFGFHVGMMRGMVHRGFNQHAVDEERDVALSHLQFFKDTHLDLHVISSFLNF